MKQFVYGFVAALLLISAGGLGYIALGLAPVATASAPLPFEKLITGIALNARVNKEAPKSSPIPASDEAYAAGPTSTGKTALFVMDCRARIKRRSPRENFPTPRNSSRVKELLTTRWV